MDNPLGKAVGNALEVSLGKNITYLSLSLFLILIYMYIMHDFCKYAFLFHAWYQVMESIDCLKGNGPSDLEELVVTQGGLLLLTSQGVVDPCSYISYFCM